MIDKTISVDLTIDEINVILKALSYQSDRPELDSKVPISTGPLIENLLTKRSELERLHYNNK